MDSGKASEHASSSFSLRTISLGSPCITIFPRCITTARSASNASSGKCVMSKMVIFSSLFKRFTTSITSFLPRGSSIAVDSSKIIIFGFNASTPAIAIRCFCPPESRETVEWRYASIPTACKAKSIRFPISSRGIPTFSGPNAISSSTMDATVWLSGFWNTIPTLLRISKKFFSLQASIPNTRTLPDWGRKSPLVSRASVDFPLPLCPKTATNSPSSTEKSSPSKEKAVSKAKTSSVSVCALFSV